MDFEAKDSVFTQYTLPLQLQKKNSNYPFKNHTQFPLMADILSRKYCHHIFLRLGLSAEAVKYFLEAFLTYVQDDHIPQAIRKMEPIYLASDEIALSVLENDFQGLKQILHDGQRYLLLILDDVNFLSKHPQFTLLLNHAHCRCIVLSKPVNSFQPIHHDFTQITVAQESASDAMDILMKEGLALENFHHVLIPEELLSQAYELANRYLCTQHTLEKALLLLDSSAARTQSVEHGENLQFKPVMTAATLYQVLSNWINIPPSHLQMNRFKINEFVAGMQQKVFGQEAAIHLLSHELQQAQAHLRLNNNIFCTLLLAGPKDSGKKTMAVALAEQLFQQTDMLYIAQSSMANLTHMAELKLQSHADKHYSSLCDVIHQKPHAIIMLEDVEQMPPPLLDELQEILSSGFIHTNDGRTFNFKHAIFIMTTTLGCKRLTEIAKQVELEVETDEVDLVQLVMSEPKHLASTHHKYTPQEIADEVMVEVASYVPAALCAHFHILPFLPLNKMAVENIIRVNLKDLGKTMETRYGVELGYAHEVVRYLTFLVEKKKDSPQPLKKALKRLYFTVEQAILAQADNKNRPTQLLLQLNDTGQTLRAEWLMTQSMRQQA